LIYSTFSGRLNFSKDLVTEKMGFLQKILQFLRGFRGFKPLCRKDFRVSGLANFLQLPGFMRNRPGQRLRRPLKSGASMSFHMNAPLS
jgi:hypothetical protein